VSEGGGGQGIFLTPWWVPNRAEWVPFFQKTA